MDFTKKGPLLDGEKLEIAQTMQIVVLNQISRNAAWIKGDAAFHGGTSINLAWNSDRWSEDLDFLLSTNKRHALMEKLPKVASGVRQQMEAAYPGCKIEVQVRPGDESKADVIDVWFVKWQHPQRYGKVLVKAEFYGTDPRLLSLYEVSLLKPSNNAGTVSVAIPTADLVSLWGDKVKAIATRPYSKWRDFYDLGFVAESLDRKNAWPQQDALIKALTVSAEVYEKSLEDVRDGLEARMSEGILGNLQAFTDDMAKWFPATIHSDFSNRGLFAQLLKRSELEISQAISLIDGWSPKCPSKP